jgi:geranylgeranyl pyrophosphate synthase
MEALARQILSDAGQPEGFLGWAMVMINNAFYRDTILSVPPERRLFLLPHCLKHAQGCPAEYNEFGMDCKRCGACSIADFRSQAENMGYRVLVAEGSPVVLKIIVSGYVDAIVGVACLNVLEKAIDKILLAGIPCLAVPLLSSDCRNTTVDESWVKELIDTPYDHSAKSTTKSYLHLMRAASDIFSRSRLDELVQRQRGQAKIEDNTKLDELDPIESTEAIITDFLAKGGKYSRPFMTLAAFDAMNGGHATLDDGDKHASAFPEHVCRAAIAIEMFHKASLIHDDIEDDDSYRYGVSALHARFGIPIAINLGDYLIGQGYRMISRHAGSIGHAAACDILDQLSSAHTRLSEGQGAELVWRERTEKRLTPLDALKIYALKTAPAFEVALYTGMRLAAPVLEHADLIKTYSRNIGVAFQILNDLKDWRRDQSNKMQLGSDVLQGRPTVLLALALTGLPVDEQTELLALVNSETEVSEDHRIRRVKQLFDSANVFDQALALVDKHQERAELIVEQFDSEPIRRLLFYLLDSVLERPAEPVLTVTELQIARAT